MSSKTVNLRDFAEELGIFTEGRLEDLKKAALLGIARSVPDLVAASPVDTGRYANSWDFTEADFGAILGNYAPHSVTIENGARPFKPPLGPLLAWAKRVLQDPSQPPNYSPRVWQMAVGVQKKIEREGMKPRHILQNAIPGIVANIKKEWEALER